MSSTENLKNEAEKALIPDGPNACVLKTQTTITTQTIITHRYKNYSEALASRVHGVGLEIAAVKNRHLDIADGEIAKIVANEGIDFSAATSQQVTARRRSTVGGKVSEDEEYIARDEEHITEEEEQITKEKGKITGDDYTMESRGDVDISLQALVAFDANFASALKEKSDQMDVIAMLEARQTIQLQENAEDLVRETLAKYMKAKEIFTLAEKEFSKMQKITADVLGKYVKKDTLTGHMSQGEMITNGNLLIEGKGVDDEGEVGKEETEGDEEEVEGNEEEVE